MNTTAPPVGAFSNLSMAAPYTYYPPRVPVCPPIKARPPFVAAENRPAEYDGKFRVVLVSSESPASASMPSLVGSLCRDPAFDLQVVATLPSLRYYDQRALDNAVKAAWNLHDDGTLDWGVRRWTDTDETEAWSKPGDPVLPSELALWADLVVVAPCSAGMLAKIVAGFTDNLALSLLRSLPPSTPTVLCPAMTPEMHANAFAQKHTITARALGFIVLGPQGRASSGKGAEAGPGEMTDWRDIVNAIQDMAALHQMRQAQAAAERNGDPSSGPAVSGYQPTYMREAIPPMPIRDAMTLVQATAKAGDPARAFTEADAAERKRNADDVVMDNGFVSGPRDGTCLDKREGKDKGKDVSAASNFESFRPGWGETVPISPGREIFARPGLPTTVPGRINLGPRAENLSSTPYQFSSADHWRLMSETGDPADPKKHATTVGSYIMAGTMMSSSSSFKMSEDGAVGMYVPRSSMQALDHQN